MQNSSVYTIKIKISSKSVVYCKRVKISPKSIVYSIRIRKSKINSLNYSDEI